MFRVGFLVGCAGRIDGHSSVRMPIVLAESRVRDCWASYGRDSWRHGERDLPSPSSERAASGSSWLAAYVSCQLRDVQVSGWVSIEGGRNTYRSEEGMVTGGC
jgi:hypothetical protein